MSVGVFIIIIHTSHCSVTLVCVNWVNCGFYLYRYVLIDTPGQIEVFTWSASGTIITEALVCNTLHFILSKL